MAHYIEIVDAFMPSARPPRRADTMAAGGSKKCGVVGCDRKHVYDTIRGAKVYSSYCQDHTCQAPRNEHTPFCINPRDPINRYCSFHGKCKGARGCINQASRSEKEPFPYICPDHRCVQRHCINPRLGHLNVCQAHLTCDLRGCPHRPQPGRRFCHAHLCVMAPNCAQPAVMPGAGHCSLHVPCGLVRGCRRLRMRFSDGHQAIHCDAHIPCAKSGSGCRQIAASKSDFCPAHKCSLEGCHDGKESKSHYCKHHTCHNSGCHQAKYDIHSKSAKYCSAHECSVDKCAHEAKTAGGFCPAHACAHSSCNAGQQSSSLYCREHCCHHDKCSLEAIHKNGFCRSHSCIEKGCKEPRLGGRDRIRQCLGHWTRDVRDNVASEYGHRADRERRELEDEIHDLEYRERIRLAAEREQRMLAEEEARREEQVRLAKAEIERQRLLDHLAKAEKERKRHEAEALIEEKVSARVAERERAERDRRAAERIAREEAEARQRAADRKFAEDLRRERLERIERERIEDDRRAGEEDLRRLRERLGRRATRYDYA